MIFTHILNEEYKKSGSFFLPHFLLPHLPEFQWSSDGRALTAAAAVAATELSKLNFSFNAENQLLQRLSGR